MRLPTPRELLEGWKFVQRRNRFPRGEGGNAIALARAYDMAEALVVRDPDEAAAALFYALTRHPKALPGARAVYAEVTLVAMLQRSGRRFVAGPVPDRLRDLRLSILERKVDWPEVCARLREMTEPSARPPE